jgi:hypothetical protein
VNLSEKIEPGAPEVLSRNIKHLTAKSDQLYAKKEYTKQSQKSHVMFEEPSIFLTPVFVGCI